MELIVYRRVKSIEQRNQHTIINSVMKESRMLSEVLNDRLRVRDMRNTVRMLWQYSRLVI